MLRLLSLMLPCLLLPDYATPLMLLTMPRRRHAAFIVFAIFHYSPFFIIYCRCCHAVSMMLFYFHTC